MGQDTLVLNVQGLTQTKCDHLTADFENSGLKLIMLTETWCTDGSLGALSFRKWVNVSSFCRRTHVRGGVGIWLERSANVQLLDLDEYCVEVHFEVCGVKFGSFYIFCCYRSPSGNFKVFIERLELVLNYYGRNHSKLILAGDFNVDLLADSREKSHLITMLLAYGLKQRVRKPTRLMKWSLLDHLYTSFDIDDNAVNVLNRDEFLSDHSPVVASILGKATSERATCEYGRRFSRHNVSTFFHCLSSEAWGSVYQAVGVNDQFNAFFDIFSFHFNNCFPVRKILQKQRKSWVNDEVRASSRCLKSLFALRGRYPELSEVYASYKRQHRNLIRCSKCKFYSDRIRGAADKNVNKIAWQTVGELTGNCRVDKNMEIISDGSVYDDPEMIAEMFGSFFVKCVDECLEAVRPHDGSACRSQPLNVCAATMYLFPLSKFELIKILNQVGNKSTRDPFDVPMRIIRDVSACVADPLLYIINSSFCSGVFPDKLKLSRVVPVHKETTL